MRRSPTMILFAAQATLVVGCIVAIRTKSLPLGVRGEWEWLRIAVPPNPLAILIAITMAGFYALYAAMALSRIDKGKRPWGWLVGLVPMTVLTQMALQEGAPLGYGLVKWTIALYNPGSSGYYTVAKKQIHELPTFLANYPTWIRTQDAFHIGTHPPGLFVTSWLILKIMEANSAQAQALVRLFPASLRVAFQYLNPKQNLPVADQASLAVTGFLVLLACSTTVWPIYAMARARLSQRGSWVATSLWPVVPAALMFQPASDTAFPLLSTLALALASWSGRWRGLAIATGVVLAVGTQFTLAFFPVGLIVALVYLMDAELHWRSKIFLILLTGGGFIGITVLFWTLTHANPFAIWSVNAANHARFYVQDPRSYWSWVVENPLELAVAIGLPTVVLIMLGFRSNSKLAWATVAVLILLTLTGKNLSEVARLWLPLMPPLLLFTGTSFERRSMKPITLASTIGLLGLQTLMLEATIQVVYPI